MAADGSDNIAVVYLHFLTTAAGVSPTEAPCSTSSSHWKINNILIKTKCINNYIYTVQDAKVKYNKNKRDNLRQVRIKYPSFHGPN